MRAPLAVVVAFVLWLAPSSSLAQVDQVVLAVREVVGAAAQAGPDQDERIRRAAGVLGQRLAEWDRAIAGFEQRTHGELPSASPDRAYQLHVERGRVYATRGRIADAMREFEAAAHLKPGASDLHALRGVTADRNPRDHVADAAFRLAWTLDPNNPLKAYHALRAPNALAVEERDAALKVLDDAYPRLSSDAATPLTLPLTVADILPDALASSPVVGHARTARGFALLAEGKYNDGVAALMSGSPSADSPLQHFEQAQRLEADSQVSQARQEYNRALSGTLVGRSIIHTGIGRLAQVEGDMTAAITAYRDAVRLNPGDATIRLELANAYVAAGRLDDALVEIVGGLLMTPASAQLHAGLGQLRLDADRPEAAIPAFTRALELDPDRYEVRYALATALTRLGRVDEAAVQLQAFERVRRELLERRRTAIQQDVAKEEALRRRLQRGASQ